MGCSLILHDPSIHLLERSHPIMIHDEVENVLQKFLPNFHDVLQKDRDLSRGERVVYVWRQRHPIS